MTNENNTGTGSLKDNPDWKLFVDMIGYARPSRMQESPEYQEFLQNFIEPVFGPSVKDYSGNPTYNYILEVPCSNGEEPRIAYMAHHDTVHKHPEKFHDDLYMSRQKISASDMKEPCLALYHEAPQDAVTWYETVTETRKELLPRFDLSKNKVVLSEKEVEHKTKITHKPTNLGYVRPSCLGADCTTGIWLMLQMIKANVPGFYIIHTDEEIGRKGADLITNEYDNLEKIMLETINWKDLFEKKKIDSLDKQSKKTWILKYINNLSDDNLKTLLPQSWWMEYTKVAISFDRKNVGSIITFQSSTRCCSENFSQDLSDILSPHLNANGYPTLTSDDGGSFTDSYNYIKIIPECTNLSVGYFSQHTSSEIQDVDFMFILRDALIANGDKLNRISNYRDPSVVEKKSYTYQGGHNTTVGTNHWVGSNTGTGGSNKSGTSVAKTNHNFKQNSSSNAFDKEVPSELQGNTNYDTASTELCFFGEAPPKLDDKFALIRDNICKSSGTGRIITSVSQLIACATMNPNVEEECYIDLQDELKNIYQVVKEDLNEEFMTTNDIRTKDRISSLVENGIFFMNNLRFDNFYKDLTEAQKIFLMKVMIQHNFKEAVDFWEICYHNQSYDIFTADWFFEFITYDEYEQEDYGYYGYNHGELIGM